MKVVVNEKQITGKKFISLRNVSSDHNSIYIYTVVSFIIVGIDSGGFRENPSFKDTLILST